MSQNPKPRIVDLNKQTVQEILDKKKLSVGDLYNFGEDVEERFNKKKYQVFHSRGQYDLMVAASSEFKKPGTKYAIIIPQSDGGCMVREYHDGVVETEGGVQFKAEEFTPKLPVEQDRKQSVSWRKTLSRLVSRGRSGSKSKRKRADSATSRRSSTGSRKGSTVSGTNQESLEQPVYDSIDEARALLEKFEKYALLVLSGELADYLQSKGGVQKLDTPEKKLDFMKGPYGDMVSIQVETHQKKTKTARPRSSGRPQLGMQEGYMSVEADITPQQRAALEKMRREQEAYTAMDFSLGANQERLDTDSKDHLPGTSQAKKQKADHTYKTPITEEQIRAREAALRVVAGQATYVNQGDLYPTSRETAQGRADIEEELRMVKKQVQEQEQEIYENYNAKKGRVRTNVESMVRARERNQGGQGARRKRTKMTFN